jgi:helicase
MGVQKQWDCGIIGESKRNQDMRLSEVICATGLVESLIKAYNKDLWLTPPQISSLKQGILEKESHFLISTPTNSGKTLISVFRMFHQALTKGYRSVFVTPLKAIAEEKRQEFETIAENLNSLLNKKIKIRITTGDYQLTDDFFDSPVPEDGDIILCTPERLEAVLRNSENHAWAKKISNLVIDEIHLIGDQQRGPTLETALTRMLIINPSVSVIGLSATTGDIEGLVNWLETDRIPVTTISDTWRYPPLQLFVKAVSDKNEYLIERVTDLLKDEKNSVLIFTYTKNDARKLAMKIASNIPEKLNVSSFPGEIGRLLNIGIAFFHAGLTMQQRIWIQQAHYQNQLRVVVATTSLKMGVNLPSTHVFIRDHKFWGAGNLTIGDILQMLGRAGRGNVLGKGELLIDDEATAKTYAELLTERSIPPLEPKMFGNLKGDSWRDSSKTNEIHERILQTLSLMEIVVQKKTSTKQIHTFLKKTFSASVQELSSNLSPILKQLQQWYLIQKIEGSEDAYEPRPLGRITCFTAISPKTGAALGGLLVAFIRLGEKEKKDDPSKEGNYLRRLQDLDLLFMACSTFEVDKYLIRSPSKKSLLSIQEYIEKLDPEEKPLFNIWRSEKNQEYNPNRLLGSLKVNVSGSAEKKFYQIMQTAILLHKHSKGVPLSSLSEEYKKEEGVLEQGLKFTTLWVLSALSQICDSRKCYKLDFLMLRTRDLIEKVTYGSGLAALLKLKGVGKRTVQKLTQAGYVQPVDLLKCDPDDLMKMGITQTQSNKILKTVQKPRR